MREEQRQMRFMSPEHVSTMNRLLAESADVRAAAATLDRDYVLAYRLTDAPGGGVAHWTMTLGPAGVRFALAAAPASDVEMHADYRDMVRMVQATRAGETPKGDVLTVGDTEVLARIAPVYAVAQQVATVDVEFAEV